MGLAAAELERAGLATVAIQFVREAAADARPPRALLAPFRYGFPADPANDPGRLLGLMKAALALLDSECGNPPILVDFRAPTSE